MKSEISDDKTISDRTLSRERRFHPSIPFPKTMEFFQSAQWKAWVIVPKITSALSIVGSSLIIRDVLRRGNRGKNLKSTTNRIVTLMSILDVMMSFVAFFLGAWMIPKEYGVWGAAGNQGTCTFQGFVGNSSAMAGTALNATLATTYVLVVRFGWKDDKLQKPLMSFVLLGMPVLASLGFNFAWPLVDQAFNWHGGWGCGIAADPFGCTINEDFYPCKRGTQAPEINYAIMLWIQVCFALIFLSTVTLYWTVLEKERATDRYAVDESQRNRRHSKRVAMQGIWYAGSFFLTWIFWWIYVLVDYAAKQEVPNWLVTMQAILVPCSGFFNAIVYFRPRFNNKSKRNSQSLGFSSLRQSSLARQAIGIFGSSRFTKRRSSDTGINATMTTGRSSSNVTSLAGEAVNSGGVFKDEEEKMEEEGPFPDDEPEV